MEEVRARVQASEGRRAALGPWERGEEAERLAIAATTEVERLTEQYQQQRANEANLLLAAALPVAGISFGEGGVPLLNGLPLEDASGAERIGLAVAVALAVDPQLKVCLVDEANDMDLDSLAELDMLAHEHGFQIWAARLGLEGAGEVVVEEGVATSGAAAQAAAAT